MTPIIDITNKELLLPYQVVAGMWKARKYIANLDSKTLIRTGVKDSNDAITYSKLKDMIIRLRTFREKQGKTPDNIWINKPKSTVTDIVPTRDWQNNKHITAIQKLIGKFNTFTEFVEKLRTHAKTKKGLYKYYLNSRFIGTQKEIEALTQGLMGNCVDFSQLARAIAIIMGYKCDYHQIQCSSVTHLIIKVSGKEFTIPTFIDLAAIVDWNSSHCPIGNKCWCTSGATVSINPNWMFE